MPVRAFPAPALLARRNFGCRAETEQTLWGYRAVTLENELLRITVLAGKGADIVEFLYKPLDVDFMWRNTNVIRAGQSVSAPTDPIMSFGEHYPGGWQELFPYGSRVQAKVYGTEMYFHGEVFGLPWDVAVEEDTPSRVTICLRVRTRKSPFVLERRMTLRSGSPVLELDETAYNLSRKAQGVMWGHHPAFGAPFLSPDCTLYAPTQTVNAGGKDEQPFPVGTFKGKRRDFSKMLPPHSGHEGMLYWDKLDAGWYALVNPKLEVGFGMRWDHKRFPIVWIWQETGKIEGAPHFGEAYAMAVEPFSHMPGAADRGEKLLTIPARGRIEARFLACAIPGKKLVKGIDAQGRAVR